MEQQFIKPEIDIEQISDDPEEALREIEKLRSAIEKRWNYLRI